MIYYTIRNDSQDAWLSGRVWYAHRSYADQFSDRQEADDIASIMQDACPNDRIRVLSNTSLVFTAFSDSGYSYMNGSDPIAVAFHAAHEDVEEMLQHAKIAGAKIVDLR